MIMPTHGTRADHDPGAGPKEGAMTGNLEALGQAAGPIWLDDLSPEPPVSGSLAKLAVATGIPLPARPYASGTA